MPCTRRQALARGLSCSAGVANTWGGPAFGFQAQAQAPVSAAPAATRTLQIVAPWEVGGLAPARGGHLFARLQVCETLVEVASDGQLIPGLAQHWRCSADGLRWRFVLRAGARFHDGSAVTAAAVQRCLEAARHPPGLLSQAPLVAIEADGTDAVVMRLQRPHQGLPHLLTHATTLILAPASYGADGSVQQVLGSGPYRVVHLAAPQRLTLTAVDPASLPPDAIHHVDYLAAGRSETRALMALSGQADLAYGLDPVSLARVRREAGARQLRLVDTTLPRTLFIKLNAGLPALADVRVRQALSLAIDREGIARALLRDPAMAATQLMPPSLPAWHDASLPPLRHDPEAARNLLQAAGATSLRLQLRTYPDRPELPLMATALQAQWRAIGVDVSVQVGNAGDIPLGHRLGQLSLGLGSRNLGTVPDPTSTLLQDYGPHGGDWGAMGWHDPALVHALHTLQQRQPTAADASALRRQVVHTLHHALPVIPVCWSRLQVAVQAHVDGVQLDPYERTYRLSAMRWRHAP